MRSKSPVSARRSKKCRYDGARRENSASSWDSPYVWLDRLRLANSMERVFLIIISFLKTNEGSVLPILDDRSEMQRRRVLNPDRLIITAVLLSFYSILLLTFFQTDKERSLRAAVEHGRGIDEVITKRSVRITVYQILTARQNNENESTSVKYRSRKWRKCETCDSDKKASLLTFSVLRFPWWSTWISFPEFWVQGFFRNENDDMKM